MGELAVSATEGDVLVSIGLGSCIGLALVERGGPAVGLAHVMLPEAPRHVRPKGAKFADAGVPLLIARLVELGAKRLRLQAVLVGGAQMFSPPAGPGLDVGGRNERAVLELLEAARIPVEATATGGAAGRTIRVHAGSGRVTAKVSGGMEVPLL
jgi:chemotaxis protein CheD